jgi:uncharacterized membrane protein
VSFDGDPIRIAKPDVGVVTTLEVAETEARANRGDLVLRNQRAGIDVVLSPVVDFGGSRSSVKLDAGSATGAGPATLIRRYKGAQQADALAAFEQDARELAKQGYEPVGQSWAEGQWGAAALLIALVLLVVLVGLLILMYMLLVKPAGTLTVTYALDGAVVAPSPTLAALLAPSGHGSFREGMAQLNELHAAGVISDEEYVAMRARLLSEI